MSQYCYLQFTESTYHVSTAVTGQQKEDKLYASEFDSFSADGCEHPIPARFRVCNVKTHGMGVKMHDGMSWHGTSLYFSMEKSLKDREIRKTYISVSVSSLNIAKNEKPIFLLFRSLIYRKHSGFLWLFLYIETRNERKYRNLSYSFLFVNCYHSFALKSL